MFIRLIYLALATAFAFFGTLIVPVALLVGPQEAAMVCLLAIGSGIGTLMALELRQREPKDVPFTRHDHMVKFK